SQKKSQGCAQFTCKECSRFIDSRRREILMEDLLANPFLSWLLKATWQASVLILFVLLIQRCLGRFLTPRWLYALWMVVLSRLVLPISYPSPFSAFTYLVPQLQGAFTQVAGKTQSAAPRVGAGPRAPGSPVPAAPTVVSQGVASTPPSGALPMANH